MKYKEILIIFIIICLTIGIVFMNNLKYNELIALICFFLSISLFLDSNMKTVLNVNPLKYSTIAMFLLFVIGFGFLRL